MTEKQKQAKLAKLTERLSLLESKLYDAKCRENEKINRMGWGHGMRCSKCSISTSRSDRIKKRIDVCNRQIEELNALDTSDTRKERSMYQVTVTADGTTATASKQCRTKREAEKIKSKLLQMLNNSVGINIVRV